MKASILPATVAHFRTLLDARTAAQQRLSDFGAGLVSALGFDPADPTVSINLEELTVSTPEETPPAPASE